MISPNFTKPDARSIELLHRRADHNIRSTVQLTVEKFGSFAQCPPDFWLERSWR